MQVWMSFVGSVAMLAIIGIAFSLMIGLVKIGEGFRYLAVSLGFALVLVLLPGTIAGLWYSLALWQRLGVLALVALLLWHRGIRPRSKGGV